MKFSKQEDTFLENGWTEGNQRNKEFTLALQIYNIKYFFKFLLLCKVQIFQIPSLWVPHQCTYITKFVVRFIWKSVISYKNFCHDPKYNISL